jgi:hypothetical protein
MVSALAVVVPARTTFASSRGFPAGGECGRWRIEWDSVTALVTSYGESNPGSNRPMYTPEESTCASPKAGWAVFGGTVTDRKRMPGCFQSCGS